MGPPPNANGSAFDPFLPCHSHHIQTERGRGPRAAQRVVRQQRSSSVPPIVDPAGNGASESRSNEPQSASSARTTPLQSPARRLTATIDVNLIPMFSRQQQQQHQQMLEPGTPRCSCEKVKKIFFATVYLKLTLRLLYYT